MVCQSHINERELKSVKRAIDLAGTYRRALEVKKIQTVRLLTDNTAVVSWLNKAQALHSEPVGGYNHVINKKRVDRTLSFARDSGFELVVDHVPSKDNLADAPSRVPEFLGKLLLKLRVKPLERTEEEDEVSDNEESELNEIQEDSNLAMVLGDLQKPETRQRDSAGRTIPKSDEDLTLFLTAVHRQSHPGASSMYSLVRDWIAWPNLAEKVRTVIGKCEACRACKGGNSYISRPFRLKGEDVFRRQGSPEDDAGIPTGKYPFERCHMDICGPLFDECKRGFITALVDSYSRFAIAVYSGRAPTTKEVVSIMRCQHQPSRISVIHTDNGPQFTSSEFVSYLGRAGIEHVMTPIHASWYNGKVERLFRTMVDRLRACLYNVETFSDNEVSECLQRVLVMTNCTAANGKTLSPQSVISKVVPWFLEGDEFVD